MFNFQFFKRKPGLCFVISAPRSGSTWLQTALNNHPEIFSTEHRFFGHFFEEWPNGDGSFTPRITLDRYTDILADYYRHDALGLDRATFVKNVQTEFMAALLNYAGRTSGCRLVVDKITPYRNTSHSVIASIKEYFPASKVIFLLRDGRDVLTSGVFDWMKRQDQGTDRYDRFVNKNRAIHLPRFFTDSDIETWAAYWQEPLEALNEKRENVHRIKFEDMKVNHAAVLGGLFDFLGVIASGEVVENCVRGSSFEKMSQGRTPGQMAPTEKIRKGVQGDWKNYFTKRDGELFLGLTGQHLVECGYESNDAWIATLPDELSH